MDQTSDIRTHAMAEHAADRGNKAIQDSLKKSRVGASYWRMDISLDSVGGVTGPLLAGKVRSGELLSELAMGRGYALIGNSKKTVDCFHMLMRALVLKRLPVVLLELPMLSAVVNDREDRYHDLAEQIHNSSVLGVAGFFETNYVQGLPEQERYQVDWFLRKWLLDNKSVILTSDVEMKLTQESWSGMLVNLLLDKTTQHFAF